MSEYTAEVFWLRGEQDFLNNRYSRRHLLRFDGGLEVAGSSSPHVVPIPMSDASAVDPEEAFIASLSSCHMLWFLSIAAKKKFCVDRYQDHAVGIMTKNEQGKLFISKVTLKPAVIFSGEHLPTHEDIDQMHHEAHKECFIANSVKTEIRCEPVYCPAFNTTNFTSTEPSSDDTKISSS
ncbi:MAG: OsmC family protein [Gammaproteobacteria bacterium]|nr:OsmC family protein [Gammaproteobacteria bacterium]